MSHYHYHFMSHYHQQYHPVHFQNSVKTTAYSAPLSSTELRLITSEVLGVSGTSALDVTQAPKRNHENDFFGNQRDEGVSQIVVFWCSVDAY